mgnify:CR=1 FL=1
MTRALPSPEELREWLEGFVDGVKGRGISIGTAALFCRRRHL